MNFILSRCSRLACRSLTSLSAPLRREVSSLGKLLSKSSNSVMVNMDKHKLVYSFRYIKQPAIVIVVSFYLSVAAFFTIIPLVVLGAPKTSLFVLQVCALAQLGLFVLLSRQCKNIVGLLLTNKEGNPKEVIICALGSRGNRVDTIHKKEDLMVVVGSSSILERFGFVFLFSKSLNEHYKVNVKHFIMHDSEAAKEIFGKDLVTQMMSKTETK